MILKNDKKIKNTLYVHEFLCPRTILEFLSSRYQMFIETKWIRNERDK